MRWILNESFPVPENAGEYTAMTVPEGYRLIIRTLDILPRIDHGIYRVKLGAGNIKGNRLNKPTSHILIAGQTVTIMANQGPYYRVFQYNGYLEKDAAGDEEK